LDDIIATKGLTRRFGALVVVEWRYLFPLATHNVPGTNVAFAEYFVCAAAGKIRLAQP